MKSILEEANEIVSGERAQDYGCAKDSFETISGITEYLLSTDELAKIAGGVIAPTVVCKMLIALKLTRESYKHKRDNLVDLCGYAELLNRLEEGQ